MLRLAGIRTVVARWRGLEKKLNDLLELMPLAEEDAAIAEEIQSEVDAAAIEIDELELEKAFTSEYDARNAILAVHAGAGGTESQDWAQMLLRMYTRWAERRGFKSEVLDVSQGEEAGIKSAVISIAGDYACGYLRSERGVHRLVRLSPFDALAPRVVQEAVLAQQHGVGTAA